MAKPQRTTTVADPLPPHGQKPGPAARRDPSYLELQDALAQKLFLSDWELGDQRSELQLRESLNRTLADDCFFCYVRVDQKIPLHHPRYSKRIHRMDYSVATESGSKKFIRPGGASWLGALTPPRAGNWAAIPKPGSRIYVLDFDVAKEKLDGDGELIPTTFRERRAEAYGNLRRMSELLEVDLRDTYAQRSPSGGIHVFLRLPAAVDPTELPSTKFNDGMRAMLDIPRENWAREFQGDIRSGAANGLILMAGSSIPSDGSKLCYEPLVSSSSSEGFKDYKMGRKLRLLELPERAVEALKASLELTVELKNSEARLRSEARRKALGLAEELSQESDSTGEPREPGAQENSAVEALILGLKALPKGSYHAARAHIYRALSCCRSNDEIGEICRRHGYARDSHGSRELTPRELAADIDSLGRRGFRSVRCGAYCGRTERVASSEEQKSAERERRDSNRAKFFELSKSIYHSRDLSSAPLTVQRRIFAASQVEARSQLQIEAIRGRSDYSLFRKRSPRYFDLQRLLSYTLGEELVEANLNGAKRKIAAYKINALELAVNYFGPLFSAGSRDVLASRAKLKELFGLTDSQLSAAMRHLRSIGAIRLSRRQITGQAPGYSPGRAKFFDGGYAYYLRRTWSSSRIGLPSRGAAYLGGALDHSGSRILRPDGSSYTNDYIRETTRAFHRKLNSLAIGISDYSRVSESLVANYLSKPLKRYLEYREASESALPASSTSESTPREALEWRSIQPLRPHFVRGHGYFGALLGNYRKRCSSRRPRAPTVLRGDRAHRPP